MLPRFLPSRLTPPKVHRRVFPLSFTYCRTTSFLLAPDPRPVYYPPHPSSSFCVSEPRDRFYPLFSVSCIRLSLSRPPPPVHPNADRMSSVRHVRPHFRSCFSFPVERPFTRNVVSFFLDPPLSWTEENRPPCRFFPLLFQPLFLCMPPLVRSGGFFGGQLAASPLFHSRRGLNPQVGSVPASLIRNKLTNVFPLFQTQGHTFPEFFRVSFNVFSPKNILFMFLPMITSPFSNNGC